MDLISIFETQPEKLVQELWHFIPDPNNWCLGIGDRNNKNYPKIIYRNKKINKISVEIIKNYVLNSIKVVSNQSHHQRNSSGIKLAKEELQRSITEIIDYNIYGKTASNEWSGFGLNHDKYDITFQIPSGDFVIVLSVNCQ
jgi:hypothetical protein